MVSYPCSASPSCPHTWQKRNEEQKEQSLNFVSTTILAIPSTPFLRIDIVDCLAAGFQLAQTLLKSSALTDPHTHTLAMLCFSCFSLLVVLAPLEEETAPVPRVG